MSIPSGFFTSHQIREGIKVVAEELARLGQENVGGEAPPEFSSTCKQLCDLIYSLMVAIPTKQVPQTVVVATFAEIMQEVSPIAAKIILHIVMDVSVEFGALNQMHDGKLDEVLHKQIAKELSSPSFGGGKETPEA